MTAMLIAAGICFEMAAAPPAWEKISSRHSESIENIEPTSFDVKVFDGVVELTLNAKTNVKVITILGQPVVQQDLEAGVWRLPLSARGIYIMKIGSATHRITI